MKSEIKVTYDSVDILEIMFSELGQHYLFEENKKSEINRVRVDKESVTITVTVPIRIVRSHFIERYAVDSCAVTLSPDKTAESPDLRGSIIAVSNTKGLRPAQR